MYKNKSFIGIIPARSGSVGLPHKNIRMFAGKPLMAWTILAALESGVLDEVFVSTDSEQYAAIAKTYGANAPFLRPDDLSGDASPASGYILHAIHEYRERFDKNFDYFVLLQPTTPLRTSEHIRDGVKMAVDDGLDSVVSFSRFDTDMRLIGELPPDLNLAAFSSRNSPNDTLRQSASQLYCLNGMLYISKCDAYALTKSFYNSNGRAMIIDDEYSIDIDNEIDFSVAEFLSKKEKAV